MRVIPADLPDVLIVEPDVHYDGRGFFLETYQADKYRAAGITHSIGDLGSLVCLQRINIDRPVPRFCLLIVSDPAAVR